MRTEGTFAPETLEAARARYESVGTTAQTVVREVAKSMDFDREEYDERVTADVVETARQAIFAESLAVHVDDAEGFASWRESYPHDVHVVGSDNVDRVAWHPAPFAETAVAATFQSEPEAAVATTRRMGFNRIYRDELEL
jgi:hypothetical protein